jgi:hypothetical protein
MLHFAETVLYSKEMPGFAMTVDLRKLRVPKMSMISEVSKWSNDPTRRAAFQQRCRGARICVRSGLRFRLAKSTLSIFFKQCPLSGPVYLMTSLEEGKSESTVTFGPASGSKKAAFQTSSKATAQSANLGFMVKDESSILDSFGIRCGGCFDFLGWIASGCSSSASSREADDAREVEELKRTVEELSARIEQLECEKRQKGSIREPARFP